MSINTETGHIKVRNWQLEYEKLFRSREKATTALRIQRIIVDI